MLFVEQLLEIIAFCIVIQKEEMCKKLNTVDLGGKICSRVTTDESSVHQKIKVVK